MNMYAAGEAIGRLVARLDASDQRQRALEARLDRWSRNLRRLVLVLSLWTLLLTGATSTEDAAAFVAALLRKLLT